MSSLRTSWPSSCGNAACSRTAGGGNGGRCSVATDGAWPPSAPEAYLQSRGKALAYSCSHWGQQAPCKPAVIMSSCMQQTNAWCFNHMSDVEQAPSWHAACTCMHVFSACWVHPASRCSRWASRSSSSGACGATRPGARSPPSAMRRSSFSLQAAHTVVSTGSRLCTFCSLTISFPSSDSMCSKQHDTACSLQPMQW